MTPKNYIFCRGLVIAIQKTELLVHTAIYKNGITQPLPEIKSWNACLNLLQNTRFQSSKNNARPSSKSSKFLSKKMQMMTTGQNVRIFYQWQKSASSVILSWNQRILYSKPRQGKQRKKMICWGERCNLGSSHKEQWKIKWRERDRKKCWRKTFVKAAKMPQLDKKTS